jgi:hypothetical protein
MRQYLSLSNAYVSYKIMQRISSILWGLVFFPHDPFQELINGAKMFGHISVYGYMWGYIE